MSMNKRKFKVKDKVRFDDNKYGKILEIANSVSPYLYIVYCEDDELSYTKYEYEIYKCGKRGNYGI